MLPICRIAETIDITAAHGIRRDAAAVRVVRQHGLVGRVNRLVGGLSDQRFSQVSWTSKNGMNSSGLVDEFLSNWIVP